MLLKAYRSDHPGSLLLLPLLVAALWLAGFIEGTPPPLGYGMPLYDGMASFFRNHEWAGWLVGALLTLTGAYICIGIARDLDFPEGHGNLPPLLFVLLIALFPSSQWAHPTSFGNVFLLIGIWRLMKIQKGGTPTPYLFDAGFSIGMASIFHIPFLLFFPFLWIASITLRSVGWRDLLWPLIGLLLPFLFLATHHYWTDQLWLFSSYFEGGRSAELLYIEGSEILSYAIWVLVGLLLLIGIFTSVQEAQRSNMQGKKLRWIFYLILPFAFITVLIASQRYGDPMAWTVLVFPSSFLITSFFARKGTANLDSFIFYLWLLLLILNYYFSSYF